MTTITIRRSTSGPSRPAGGFLGVLGVNERGNSSDIEVSLDIDSLDPGVIDAAALSATTAFNVVESFPESGIIEFVDEAAGADVSSQSETGVVYTEADAEAQAASGLEETEVDGKSAEELGLQDGAAYYITTSEGERMLTVYTDEYFEDRYRARHLGVVNSFRFAAPAVES